MAEEGYKVTLHVYDLSNDQPRQLSMSSLGKAIEATWHTCALVYGTEYFFGAGIQQTPAGIAPYGAPLRILDLGVTHVRKDVFEMYLQGISPRYTAATYSLLSYNCNNFSSEIAQFLVGASILDYILNLPNEVMSNPMRTPIHNFLVRDIIHIGNKRDLCLIHKDLGLLPLSPIGFNVYDTKSGDDIEGMCGPTSATNDTLSSEHLLKRRKKLRKQKSTRKESSRQLLESTMMKMT
ncbi:hypothetical protein OROGR_032560 [Orobanche gracilis]